MADGCGIRVMRVDGVGKVSLISLVDVTSRLKAERYPSLDTSNPALPDYQLTGAPLAFLTYGLPHTLTLDHGTVFYENKTPSPIKHALACMADCRFQSKCALRGIRCPTDHAIIERTHQTLTAQALLGQAYPSHSALWAELDARRDVLESACAQSGSLPSIPAPSLSASPSLGASVPTGVGRRGPVTGKGVHLSGPM